jgi:hypothetical protein
MSGWEFVAATVAGLAINEFSDVSPWLAAKLARWSAYARYTDPDRAAVRAEELSAVVRERPGKLLNLLTASGFAASACVARVRRICTVPTRVADHVSAQQHRPRPDDLPSGLVSPYLLPTERYRGEWRRHWVKYLPEALLVGVTTTGCGYLCGVALHRGQLRLAVLAVVLWVAVLLVVGWRYVGWYRSRVVFTSDRVVIIVGAIRKHIHVLPLASTRMDLLQSRTGRLLSYGTFAFETLGATPGKVKVRNMPNPHSVMLYLANHR